MPPRVGQLRYQIRTISAAGPTRIGHYLPTIKASARCKRARLSHRFWRQYRAGPTRDQTVAIGTPTEDARHTGWAQGQSPSHGAVSQGPARAGLAPWRAAAVAAGLDFDMAPAMARQLYVGPEGPQRLRGSDGRARARHDPVKQQLLSRRPYGIRRENRCCEAARAHPGRARDDGFETLTLVQFDRRRAPEKLVPGKSRGQRYHARVSASRAGAAQRRPGWPPAPPDG